MLKTGDWSIQELIKYLCNVQNTLTDVEMQRLKLTAAFPKEDSAPLTEEEQQEPHKPAGRFKASDLYEPTDVHRSLGLPIIRWSDQHRWRAASEEGEPQFGVMPYV